MLQTRIGRWLQLLANHSETLTCPLGNLRLCDHHPISAHFENFSWHYFNSRLCSFCVHYVAGTGRWLSRHRSSMNVFVRQDINGADGLSYIHRFKKA
jgi:hypothetical protein